MADKPTPEQERIAELELQLEEARASLRAPASPAAPALPPRFADKDAYNDGEFKHRETGEKFSLKIVKDDPQGRTHKLKNDEHFHECSEADLRKDYDKA